MNWGKILGGALGGAIGSLGKLGGGLAGRGPSVVSDDPRRGGITGIGARMQSRAMTRKNASVTSQRGLVGRRR